MHFTRKEIALLCLVVCLIIFYASSPCLKIQVTPFGFQQLKGLGLSSAKSDLKHIFKEMCCWYTRLWTNCSGIKTSTLKGVQFTSIPTSQVLWIQTILMDLCFIRGNISGWHNNSG